MSTDHTDTLANYLVTKGYAKAPQELTITLIKGGISQNHHNYQIVSPTDVFVARVAAAHSVAQYASLADEYTILKLVEPYAVGPHALAVDLGGYEVPLMLEEFIDGTLLSDLPQTDELVGASLDLISATSAIPITPDQYPFKYSYTTYRANTQKWIERLNEMKVVLDGHPIIAELTALAERGTKALAQYEPVLAAAPQEFMFNDVHGGNMFLLSSSKIKFIDWQKVSIGDPSFMVAGFVNRFADQWSLDPIAFAEKIVELYASRRNIPNFADLVRARIIERAVSDSIWVPWAEVKHGQEVSPLDKKPHFGLAQKLLA